MSTVCDSLDQQGWALLNSHLDQRSCEAWLAGLITLARAQSRDTRWSSTRKLHVENLFDAGPLFDGIWFNPTLVALAETVLGKDWYVLGARYRAPLPGAGEQTMHADDGGYDPLRPRVLNVIVALVAFTDTNGATRVMDGSHRYPPVTVPDDPLTHVSGEKLVRCSAGSALMFGGGLWHSGTRNLSDQPRHAIAISYARRRTGLPDVVYASPHTLARLGPAAERLHP